MIKCNSNILQAITFMTIMLYSCDDKAIDPKEFNEIIAEIVEVTPGHTSNFKATGSNTNMGCYTFGLSTTSIRGTDVNNANATIDISVMQCVTSEGNYSIEGYYDRSKISEAYDPDFISYQNGNYTSGSITFTKRDGKYMEGNFNVVLYCFPYSNCDEKDSVIVRGSFKGQFLDY